MSLVGLGKRPSSRRSASLVAVEYGGCGCAVEVGMGGYGWDSSIFLAVFIYLLCCFDFSNWTNRLFSKKTTGLTGRL
jgi:hypothetical protein